MSAVLEWDYSALAAHYDKRAPYAEAALDALLAALALPRGARVVDVGAGTGRLALPLAQRGCDVTAVEPNAAMRAIGHAKAPALRWVAAPGEATTLPAACCELVTYGSSFNVLDAAAALREARRLLVPRGAIALLWNHRELDDPLQQAIEAAIRRRVPEFDYGARREDPTRAIAAAGGFHAVNAIEHRFVHATPAADFLAGFRAHATLIRQAAGALEVILADIAALLRGAETVAVPFVTRAWYARRSDECTP